ncbi:MAG: radical SAM protein, partial [Candidatus Altiarchaeota archaeon]|nr:radical SAM protein [Candidatus Altiarchaeota archaeon]
GCPFNCIFCADVSTKVRSRSPANVVAELSQMISGYGLRRIDFADSVFTLDRQRVLDLCDLIKKNNLRFKWTCLTRCDLVDEELLSEMKSAGCFLVLFGVESGVEEVRARIGKLISDEKIREAFKLSRKIGLKTGVSVMFGHPNEKLDEMRKTIDFACSLKADYGVFSVSELMPGTKLFEIAVQEGYAKPTLWQDYMQGRIPHLYYAPKGVTFNDLLAVTAQAHKKFYHNLPHIIQRIQGIDSKIELDETINTIQNYVLDKAGM